jgi:hypothetical protein
MNRAPGTLLCGPRSVHALALLVVMLPLALIVGGGGIARLNSVFTGPEFIGELSRGYRMFDAALDITAAVCGILVALAAVFASRMEAVRSAEQDDPGAEAASSAAQFACSVGWIIAILFLIGIVRTYLQYAGQAAMAPYMY